MNTDISENNDTNIYNATTENEKLYSIHSTKKKKNYELVNNSDETYNYISHHNLKDFNNDVLTTIHNDDKDTINYHKNDEKIKHVEREEDNINKTHIEMLRKLKSNQEINLKRGEEINKNVCTFLYDDFILSKKKKGLNKIINKLSLNTFNLYFRKHSNCYIQVPPVLNLLRGDIDDILIGLKYLFDNIDEINFLILNFLNKLKKKKKIQKNKVLLHLIDFILNKLFENNLNYRYKKTCILDFYDNLMFNKNTFFESGIINDAINIKDLRLIYFYKHNIKMKKEKNFLVKNKIYNYDKNREQNILQKRDKKNEDNTDQQYYHKNDNINKCNYFVINQSTHLLNEKYYRKKRRKKKYVCGEIPLPNKNIGIHKYLKNKSIFDNYGYNNLVINNKKEIFYNMDKCVQKYITDQRKCEESETNICTCIPNIIVNVNSDARLREIINTAKKEVRNVKNVLIKIKKIEHLVDKLIKYDKENIIVEDKNEETKGKKKCSQNKLNMTYEHQGGEGKEYYLDEDKTGDSQHNEHVHNENIKCIKKKSNNEDINIYLEINQRGINNDHINDDHINDDHINDDHINDDHINDDHINDDHINNDHINDDHINDDHINNDHINNTLKNKLNEKCFLQKDNYINSRGKQKKGLIKRKYNELTNEEKLKHCKHKNELENYPNMRKTFSQIFSSEERERKRKRKEKREKKTNTKDDVDRKDKSDKDNKNYENNTNDKSDKNEDEISSQKDSDESIKTFYFEEFDFNFVLLGSVKKGSDRHKSLLFKVLCDSIDIPCRYIRYVKNKTVHYFNLVLIPSIPAQNITECLIPIFWENNKIKIKTNLNIQSKITISNFLNNIKIKFNFLDNFFLKIWENNNEVINIEDYFIFEKKLGMGGFGEVWKVKLKNGTDLHNSFFYSDIKNTSTFALKILDMNEFNLNESIIMREKAHTNIVKIYCVFKGYQILINRQKENEKKESLCFLLELADTSLEKLFCDKRTVYNLNFVRLTLLEIANIMSYIHKPNIKQEFYIYRDLKPDNVLIKGKKILITDFNLSRKVDQDFEFLMSQCCGTKGHLAPEQKSVCYDKNVDVWAFSIIISKFLKHQNFHYFSHCMYDINLSHFEIQDEFLINLLLACIDDNPFMRPTFEEISHLLFNEIIRNELEQNTRLKMMNIFNYKKKRKEIKP
ncbi:protein kinase, putative [Plasmodium reichenowi]|uniref:Protein kinase, putative n=1 Tax=Plasmodium reichenowi TaxID=5854 RepID=A0A151LHY2_PLARE|nr:protein kinase, putative [Plasmodium reichenowi]KYN98553.1 protein kinase, putative [Plasmodium reichenowi]